VTKTIKTFVLVKIGQKTPFFDGTKLASYKNEAGVLRVQNQPSTNTKPLIKNSFYTLNTDFDHKKRQNCPCDQNWLYITTFAVTYNRL
jgi:hypothetical protein